MTRMIVLVWAVVLSGIVVAVAATSASLAQSSPCNPAVQTCL